MYSSRSRLETRRKQKVPDIANAFCADEKMCKVHRYILVIQQSGNHREEENSNVLYTWYTTVLMYMSRVIAHISTQSICTLRLLKPLLCSFRLVSRCCFRCVGDVYIISALSMSPLASPIRQTAMLTINSASLASYTMKNFLTQCWDLGGLGSRALLLYAVAKPLAAFSRALGRGGALGTATCWTDAPTLPFGLLTGHSLSAAGTFGPAIGTGTQSMG